MYKTGRLLTFLDTNKNYTLNFLNSGEILDLLYNLHHMPADGQRYFEDAVLTSLQLINFLKPLEMLGLYIDSTNPKFMLKIEMNESGSFRTLLLPEDFNQFPDQLTGECRLTKMMGRNSVPYTSIISLEKISFSEVINKILKESYQVDASIQVFKHKPFSLMVHHLPRAKGEASNDGTEAKQIESVRNLLTNTTHDDDDAFIKEIENMGFIFLRKRDILFRCNCSRERMVSGLFHLSMSSSIEEVFEGKNDLETRCDYCKTSYLITKEEVKKINLTN